VSELTKESWSLKIAVRRFVPAIALIVVGVCLDIVGQRFIAPSRSNSEARAIAEVPFSRVGDRIVVPENSSLRTRLALEAPISKMVSHTLVLPALVEADPARTVKVMPPVAGRVIDLKVQLGGRVVEGQELAIIDSGDLAQAYADIEKARSMLTLTKKQVDRQMSLEKAGGTAIKDREQAQSDYAQAVAELERSEIRLRAMGVPAEQKEHKGDLRQLLVKAPITGSVIDLQIAPGAFLNDNTAAMMTIANLDKIWVTANVPEKDTSFVATDQPVSVTFAAYPEMAFEGKVLFVSDVLEPDTRRTKVRIEFDNPEKRLKPGMFANATFNAPAVSRLVVPTSALLMSNDRTSIFAEVQPWTFERRDVVTDYEEGNTAVIKSGLKPGERIIVKGGVVFND
jgi:membrane fusion protein, heavy metal efflux system